MLAALQRFVGRVAHVVSPAQQAPIAAATVPVAVARASTRRSSSTVAKEPAFRTITKWDVSRLERAKRLADIGDLSEAAQLWDRVRSSPRAVAAIQSVASVGSLPVTFESKTEQEDHDADPRVQALDADWWDFVPEELQGDILATAAGLGICPVQIVEWVETNTDPKPSKSKKRKRQTAAAPKTRLIPKLKVWSAEFLKWDRQARHWTIKTDGGKYVPCIHGDGEWLLFTPYGVRQPHQHAPWYELGLLWLGSLYATIDWQQWNDSHALPRPTAHLATFEAGMPSDADLASLVSKLEAWIRGAPAIMPTGYKAELLETSSKNWESYLKLIDEVFPRSLAEALTGNNLTTQIDGGSYAAARAAENVSAAHRRLFARCLETTLHTGVLIRWCEANFGDLLAPWPHYEIEPPADLVAATQRLSNLGSAVQSMSAAGLPIDAERLVEEYGAPLDLEQVAEAKPSQLFQYHFSFGIITVNEARARIGLPPIEGGDVPPKPLETGEKPDGPPKRRNGDEPKDPDDGTDPEEDEESKARAAILRAFPELHAIVELSDRNRAGNGDGDAEDFTDELEAQALAAAAKQKRPDVAEVIQIVRGAKDLREVRERIVEHFGDMTDHGFADVVERAETLAALAGVQSIAEE